MYILHLNLQIPTYQTTHPETKRDETRATWSTGEYLVARQLSAAPGDEVGAGRSRVRSLLWTQHDSGVHELAHDGVDDPEYRGLH